MNAHFRITLLCMLAILSTRSALAADAAPPVLAKPGKLLFEDDFARAEMAPKWKVGKGFWSVKDGVVTAAENPEDHHGAYAYIVPNVDFKDVVAEFSFKLDGARSIHLNMRDSKYKGSHAGHVLRATIMQNQVQLVDMKTGGMKNEYYEKTSNPSTPPEEKKAIQARIKDKTANFKVPFDPNEWHQARVEVAGDEMIMLIDGKIVGYLKSEGIDHPTKNMLGFTVGGKAAEIRNVKFQAGEPAPEWAKDRAKVVEGLKK